MKNFIKKLLVLIILNFLIYIIISEILVEKLPRFSSKFLINHDWLNTNLRIKSLSKNINNDTIYIGCSVAAQLLPFEDSNNNLTFVGSTLPMGNYFLIKNAIENNDKIKTIIYYTAPNILTWNFERAGTHQYFVKPFFNFQNKKEILRNQYLRDVLQKNKLLYLNQFNFYKLLPLDDFNYYNPKNDEPFSLSDESLEWIAKIDSICNINNIKFHLASPPIPKKLKKESSDWKLIRDKILDSNFDKLFEKYFETIIYYDNIYSSDSIHMNLDFALKNKTEFISHFKKVLAKDEIE